MWADSDGPQRTRDRESRAASASTPATPDALDSLLHLGPAHQLHDRADHEDEGYQNRHRSTDPHDLSARGHSQLPSGRRVTRPARWQADNHVDDPEPFLDAVRCPAQAPRRSTESTTSPRWSDTIRRAASSISIENP